MSNKGAGKKIKQKQKVNSVERRTYTVEEAATILGICRSLAYRPGVLPTLKFAGRRVVPKQWVHRTLGEGGRDAE